MLLSKVIALGWLLLLMQMPRPGESGGTPGDAPAAAPAAGPQQPTSVEGLVVGTAADFGLPHLADGMVVQFDAPPENRSNHRLRVALIGKKTVALDLRPISLRDPHYELREQLADGSWRAVDPGPENTYTGTVAGEPDGFVAASWTGEGLLACVEFADGQKHWLQPLSDFMAGADPGLHVAYRGTDTHCEGFCGNPGLAELPTPTGSTGPRGGCGGDICVAQLACDADFEYYTARGSSTHAAQDRIHAILNVMNHQYVREVQITHVITTVLVRTAEPDPYTSNISDTLLCEFITEWTNNQFAITRDVAKLFTGRDISGATIGQAANFGQICDNSGFCTAGLDNGAYCYTQSDFSASFACQTDLAAHEMGHLWGAHHCNCPSSTMNSSITCVNTFTNSGGVSQAEIDAHADAVACLTALQSPPANDTCDDATILPGGGTYAGSNLNSSTDGGAIGCGPLGGNVGGGRNDVFFRITALANGTASVDACGSNFDTMVSIHSGCPATPANQIACNDDCGGSPCGCCDSCLTFAGTSGTTYYIRVAGYNGATGSITLNVSGPFVPGNNACANAIPVTDGTAINGTLALASNDGAATCGSSSSNPDAWYTFTAGPCGGVLTVDTCGTHDRLGQDTGMDTVVSIHSACPGTTGNQLTCNDDASPACAGDAGLIRDSRATATLSPNQSVRIRVSHFSTAIDDGFFRLNVSFQDALAAPVVNAIGNEAHDCGGAYTGPTPGLTNAACMTPVTWSLVNGPAGMTISASTGVVSWPVPTPSGSPHTITIRATNATAFDDETWTLTVALLEPVANNIPNAAHPCGSHYNSPMPTLTIPGCMGPVTWSLITAPAGATINASTGVVSWPTPTSVGTPHTFLIRATNTAGFDDEGWRLAVDPIAPIVSAIPNGSHNCGMAYTGPTPTLTNSTCMGTVTWSLAAGPVGMTIHSGTGVVSWPAPTSAGSPHNISIRATNAAGIDNEAWSLTVLDDPQVGDLNCDGALTVSDIAGFVLAVTSWINGCDAYAQTFPNCECIHADINCDGAVSVSDIGPFVDLLTTP